VDSDAAFEKFRECAVEVLQVPAEKITKEAKFADDLDADSLDLVELATPRLQELANSTGETVNLAVLTGDQVLYLVRLRNSDLVTANIRVGSLLPAVHTSIGKLLLAYLDDADLEKAITAQSFTGTAGPNAKRSVDELRPELAAIRAQVESVIFTGRGDVARRLADIAAQHGVRLVTGRPTARLDLGDDFFAAETAIEQRCADFLASLGA